MIRWLFVFVIVISLTACIQAQVIRFENILDSLVSELPFEEKLHQIYPYDVLNTGDNPWHRIGGFYMTDGPHGYRYPPSTGGAYNGNPSLVPSEGRATSFPVSLAVAATWDTSLARRMARSMGNEFAARGINQPLAPSLYLCNEPRNGRSAESYGEDPFLAARIGVATVKGLQSTPSIATIKSFLGENAQNTRMTDSISMGRRMLMEHWGIPFKQTIQDANAFCVMSAYVNLNDLNSPSTFHYSSENASFNSEILRTAWGFPYYMVSDWGAVHNAPKALQSGLDLCMGTWHYATDLWQPIVFGQLPVVFLDLAVKRVLRTKMLSGITDWMPAVSDTCVSGTESISLCYETGVKSLVLLKNENNILPIDTSGLNYIAVIGPSAAMPQLDGYGSSFVFPTSYTTIVESVISKVGATRVLYAPGCDINSNDTSGFGLAAAYASYADVVVFAGGLDWEQEGEGLDRLTGSISLPGKQQDLINRLSQVNPNLAVVIISGGIVSLENCQHNIRGLLYGFYPGQEQGRAVCDVLFGEYNPGGKLPVTMPANDSQLPPRNTNFDDDWGCGYRWFDKQALSPAFCFGYGLSYTTFTYNSMHISSTTITAGENLTVTVSVTNTGFRAGDEVVQLYLTHPTGFMPMPEKQLKGFSRVSIDPGDTVHVSFTLTPEDLYVYDEALMSYTVLPGTYHLCAGGSSEMLPLCQNFTVVAGPLMPDIEPSAILCYPPYPHTGDTVIFLVNVKNKGIASMNNEPISGILSVEGIPVAGINETVSVMNGGMIQAEATVSLSGRNFWVAGAPGNYNVSVGLDPGNHISECNEGNNVYERILTVFDSTLSQPETNLAFRKPCIASTVADTHNYAAAWAVDGFRNSKWKSNGPGPDTLTVDLLATFTIERIVVFWAETYATTHILLGSEDMISWDTLAQENAGNGGKTECMPYQNLRYIRLVMSVPDSIPEFSVFEIQAFGYPVATSVKDIPEEQFLVYPNPCHSNHDLCIQMNNDKKHNIKIISTTGKCLMEKDFVERVNMRSVTISPGLYFLKITDLETSLESVQKLIIVK